MDEASPDILIAVHIPKETNQMNLKKTLGLMFCVLLAVSSFAQMPKAQNPHGKAELKINSGSITIDYGRPALKGRDPFGPDLLGKLKPGEVWRMGSEFATVINTPVDLTFGSTKIAKGSYSLFLNVAESGKYELLFNSQTGQWGLMHDKSKDVASVPIKKEKLPSSVELLTIDLNSAPGGGVIAVSWATTILTSEFKIAQ
jgi:hypothetical protein